LKSLNLSIKTNQFNKGLFF